MEIDFIKRKNGVGTKETVPAISISKGGIISLNRYAVETMSLDAKNMVAVGHDKSSPKDWYIVRSTEGYKLRKSASSKGGLCFNSSAVTDEINKSMGNKENKTMRFAVAPQPTQYNDMMLYAIITSKLL